MSNSTHATAEIRPASVADICNFARGLLKQHWLEVAKHKDILVLRPDWDRYAAMAASGNLFAIAAWVSVIDGDEQKEEMVGYSANLLFKHLHYADATVCQNDVLFVAEDYRKSRIGMQLMRETERIASARGAKLMLWHAKEGTALDRMLGRPNSGYDVQDIIYGKEI